MLEFPTLEVIGIAVAILFSGVFSSSETALTTLAQVRLQQLIDSKRFGTQLLTLWHAHPNRVLITILIGNNIANISASALATDLAIRLFPDRGVALAIGAMTFLLLVTGEITPKTFARTYPVAVAIPTMAVVWVFYGALFPLTWVLTLFTRLLMSLIGGKRDDSSSVTERDLAYLVRLGATAGTIDKDQESLFQSVIEFPETLAREIMTPRTDLVALPLGSTFEQIVEVAIDSGFSRIPVYEDSIDKVVGIFYAKHLLGRSNAEEQREFLNKCMRRPVFVPDSKRIGEMLKLFQKRRIHMAVVVNEFGGTEGVVTLEDVIEELLGDITDEFDEEEIRLVELPHGAGLLADARVDIEDVEAKIPLMFPEDRDYESLGGFLMATAATVPETGWRYEFGGFAFTVTDADANRIIHVRIEPAPEPQVEEEDQEADEGIAEPTTPPVRSASS